MAMSVSRIPEPIRRIFAETFTAKDIAEPLASFDAGTSAAVVRNFMRKNDYDMVGIRDGGHIVGITRRDQLGDGPCGQFQSSLVADTVCNDDLPLLEVLRTLNHAPFILLKVFGKVT